MHRTAQEFQPYIPRTNISQRNGGDDVVDSDYNGDYITSQLQIQIARN